MSIFTGSAEPSTLEGRLDPVTSHVRGMQACTGEDLIVKSYLLASCHRVLSTEVALDAAARSYSQPWIVSFVAHTNRRLSSWAFRGRLNSDVWVLILSCIPLSDFKRHVALSSGSKELMDEVYNERFWARLALHFGVGVPAADSHFPGRLAFPNSFGNRTRRNFVIYVLHNAFGNAGAGEDRKEYRAALEEAARGYDNEVVGDRLVSGERCHNAYPLLKLNVIYQRCAVG